MIHSRNRHDRRVGERMEQQMSHPLEDGGFTLWQGDLETQLKRIYGVSLKELGLARRMLQDSYYGGTSVFAMLDEIVQQHVPAHG